MRRGVTYYSEIPGAEICKLQWAQDQASAEAAMARAQGIRSKDKRIWKNYNSNK